MNKNNIRIALSVFILVGFIGYFIYIDLTAENDFVAVPVLTEEQLTDISEEKPSTTEFVEEYVENGDNAVVLLNVPNLDKEIIVPDSYSTEQKKEITNKIKDITAFLKQDPNLFNEWLDLGLFRKSIEDYEGAREAWEYASTIRPENSLSFGNLGVLYGYYLQNPTLAEKNYLKALENDPKLPYLYIRTADFYIEVMDNTEKARAVFERGVLEIPGDETLKMARENL